MDGGKIFIFTNLGSLIMGDDSKSWEYLAFEIMVLLKYATSSEFQCVDEESQLYFIIFS